MSIANADDLDWRASAACLEHPAETFFPDPNDMTSYYAAVKICSGCPVKAACLADALESRDTHSIRAGLGVKERAKMLKKKPGPPRPEPSSPQCGTEAGYQRHRRRSEPACVPCVRAASNRKNVSRVKERAASCGMDSHARYVRHQHRRETACVGCCTAESAYTLARRAARRVNPAA